MLEIVDSSCDSVRLGEFDLRVLATACTSTGAGFNLTVKSHDGREFSIWIAMIQYSHVLLPLTEAIEACEDFLTNTRKELLEHFIITFETDILGYSQMAKPKFLLLASSGRISTNYDPSDKSIDLSMNEKNEEESRLIFVTDAISNVTSPSRTMKVWVGYLLIFGIVLAGGLFKILTRKPARYERYPTPGSIGPKHQSRLLYNNATSWARDVSFDDKNWRIRIDDQALVPAHLYTTDEDHYQKWFRQRYPHLQEIVERHDYLRPSWLGSSQIAVPWDEQFHFAHCVLALRRYWTAKETGTHLCGRDIDYAHIKHCLDSLDEKAFPPGPMEDVGKGYRLWWQTKVCYD